MKRIFAALLALVCSSVFSATLVPVGMLNPTGSTAGQTIVSTGSSTSPVWGTVPLTGLSSVAANTVIANTTASSGAPSAFAMPSCSTSSSALDWATSTGFTCNTSINAATLGGATFAAPGPIGSTTASTGAFTTLSASNTVSGTGFSAYLASPPAIGGTAAASGKFTTLQATSTITPSTTAGIVGTTAGDNAQTGSVGEVISSSVPIGSAVGLTSGTAANITSISLTAGDWDVWGTIATNPAGTTTQSLTIASINTVSGAQATLPNSGAMIVLPFAAGGGSGIAASVGTRQINVTSTTTVYLVITSTFATSTNAAYGFLAARRRR